MRNSEHAQTEVARKRSEGAPRLLQPNRLQVELRASYLESLLPEDHRVRLVWGYVVRQDLSKLIEAVKARGSNAGRAAIDPQILFVLWLYATLQGVGSGWSMGDSPHMIRSTRCRTRQRYMRRYPSPRP